jgi:diguanylate cyclase (GGDEF)-like protein
MRRLIDRIFDQLTPVSRVQVAVWSSTPFFIIVLVGHGLALGSPEIRAGLQPGPMLALQGLIGVCTAVNLIVAVRLWPQRRQPDPVDGSALLVCLSIGLAYTGITILAGTFTAGTNLILVGVLAIGLLLFPLRPMVIAYVVCTGLMFSHDLLVMGGWLAYAPALNANIFHGREPVWWFALWREFVFVVGWAVLSVLLMLLFARLDHLHARLTRLSYTDGLTGLANRRRFMEVLGGELARQGRSGQRLCLVMLDIDHFKQVNDEHGHLAGDTVLRRLSELLMTSVRTPSDLPARLGGEEFAVVLPDTDEDEARQVCERLRERVAELAFEEAGRRFRITVSLGLVEARGMGLEAVLRHADRALYRAKQRGRNRLCVVGELEEGA